MSLAMTFRALVRWRISPANGRRMSLVSGISKLPVEIAETDMPKPDIIEHAAFHVTANSGGDHPVDQLAVAGVHQVVGRELRELRALATLQDRQHVLVERLIDMSIERRARVVRHAAR